MRSYRISNDAKEDLRRIYAYGYNEFGEEQADKYYFFFFEVFEKLAENPLSYQSVDYLRPNYRRAICGTDSIYYRVGDSYIEIMAILGGQDTEQWL
jgi:toxin ParE1/3/4